MKKKNTSRIIITLECINCRIKKNNQGVSVYITTKNKKNLTTKLELNKYCKFCKKHVKHKELK